VMEGAVSKGVGEEGSLMLPSVVSPGVAGSTGARTGLPFVGSEQDGVEEVTLFFSVRLPLLFVG